ncbi:MAG: penicillin-binding protein 2 [Oligosphaeraceae bacterium]
MGKEQGQPERRLEEMGPVSPEIVRGRTMFCAVVVLLLVLLLLLRLWQVQVLSGPELQARARRQAIRPVRLNPVRGRILDASGAPLAENEDRYDLVFYVSEMRQPGRQSRTIEHILTLERILASYLGRASGLQREAVLRQMTRRPILPLTVFQDLTPEERIAFSEYLPIPPGVEIMPVAVRRHPRPGLLSHLLGYTGRSQPDGSDVLEDLPRLYATSETRGRSGLEMAFDEELAGKPGVELLLVDPVGYARRRIGERRPPENGHDLHLTIDSQAQAAAEAALEGQAGALVVVEAHSGAVVVMASSPSFNLEELSSPRLQAFLKDEKNRPMFNRATQGTYTPGSIVKPLVALAALEEVPELTQEEYVCDGRFLLGNTAIRCAQRYGHGLVDLPRAIRVSCNPYFIWLGQEMGIDRLGEYMAEAGFGAKSGIEVGDAAGISPTRAVARRLWRRNWLAIDTAYVSIGQGAITITPLQAALYAAALANGGVLYTPYTVRKITSPSGELLQEIPPRIRGRLSVSPENLALVQEAMAQAVESREGGATGLRIPGLPVAAKTGTAEVGRGEGRHKNTWVIAFFPAHEPKYALACLVERGESGGKTAVPVAARFLKKWLLAE